MSIPHNPLLAAICALLLVTVLAAADIMDRIRSSHA